MPPIYGDRWRVERPLGEGGQAHTFIVIDESSPRSRYVLKRLKNLKRLDRFEREILAVRRLEHPNILRLVDFDLTAEKPYFVTEFCAGGSLEDNRERVLRWEAADQLKVFFEIASAAQHAHDSGIIHRDIKPDNIFLREENGPAVLGDFGICYVEEGSRFTLTDEAVGARFFIAPEVEDGRSDAVSQKTDVYSLGKLLYSLLTGKTFTREKHRLAEYNIVNLRGDYFLEHVNSVLDKMIAEDVAARFETVSEAIRQLKEASRLMAGTYNPLTEREQLCRYCGRGNYKPVSRERLRNYDADVMAAQSLGFQMLFCPTCGNLQSFFLNDEVSHRDWLEAVGLRTK